MTIEIAGRLIQCRLRDGKQNMYEEYPYLPGVSCPVQQQLRLRALHEERLALIRMRLAAPSGVEQQVQVDNIPLYTPESKFLNSILLPLVTYGQTHS